MNVIEIIWWKQPNEYCNIFHGTNLNNWILTNLFLVILHLLKSGINNNRQIKGQFLWKFTNIQISSDFVHSHYIFNLIILIEDFNYILPYFISDALSNLLSFSLFSANRANITLVWVSNDILHIIIYWERYPS